MWFLVFLSISGNPIVIDKQDDHTLCVRHAVHLLTDMSVVKKAWCISKTQWETNESTSMTTENEVHPAP